MQLFSADARVFKKKLSLTLKTLKNHPKKLHTYGSWEFFLCSPDCPKQSHYIEVAQGDIFMEQKM